MAHCQICAFERVSEIVKTGRISAHLYAYEEIQYKCQWEYNNAGNVSDVTVLEKDSRTKDKVNEECHTNKHESGVR